MDNFLQSTLLGNKIQAYVIWFLVLAAGIFIIGVLKTVFIHRIKKLAEKTTTKIDDFIVEQIEKILVPMAYFMLFYFSIQFLSLSPAAVKAIHFAGKVFVTIFGIKFSLSLLNYLVNSRFSKYSNSSDKLKSINAFVIIVKVIIAGIGLLLLLDNLGVKISALVAGLGIGGVAVALASQAILGDLFSFFVILFDRPFEIGDFIIVGDFMGTVENIGIKTTRLRSLSGEELIFSNTYLTNSQVRNYKRMERRRVVTRLGVTYDTSLEKLKLIPELFAQIIKSIDGTVFDRAHFASYGDFNLIIEAVYYVSGSDYNKYMDINQQINFKIKEEFDKRAIQFAFPTQTLYINKQPN